MGLSFPSSYFIILAVLPNFNVFNLIDIADTIAPSSSHMILSRKCVPPRSNLSITVTCYYNGSVKILGKCRCKTGYTNIQRKCICKFFLRSFNFETTQIRFHNQSPK